MRFPISNVRLSGVYEQSVSAGAGYVGHLFSIVPFKGYGRHEQDA
ncbi:MAG TPA: hypothetical protein VIY29_17630 [Ktedonobacteraceae bacterium]